MKQAPFCIAALRGGAHHIADNADAHAWCGADVARAVRFEFEPGMDFGAHRDDCADCMRRMRELGHSSERVR